MYESPEKVDWCDNQQQEFYFDQFKSPDSNGIKFNQFQKFLNSIIYPHFNRTREKCILESGKKFSYQQEIQLFKLFDLNNDHSIGREEFSSLCSTWLKKTFNPSSALVVVDVQNDFIDGSLALIKGAANQDGADVVPIINNLLDKCSFQAVVYTQDWHPIDHIGFHENLHMRKYKLKRDSSAIKADDNEKHLVSRDGEELQADEKSFDVQDDLIDYNEIVTEKNGIQPQTAKLFDTVLFDEGRIEQKLWPIHCVQNSWGAELHPKLKTVSNSIRIHKGTRSHVDAYSAFWDNMKLNETGLRQELTSRKIDDVYFCGLALDYCVSASALDSVEAGFTTFVIEDACRGTDLNEMEKRKLEMLDRGVILIDSYYLLNINNYRDKNNGDSNYDYNVQLQLDLSFRKAQTSISPKQSSD